jgi:hypothetical protein
MHERERDNRQREMQETKGSYTKSTEQRKENPIFFILHDFFTFVTGREIFLSFCLRIPFSMSRLTVNYSLEKL